MKASFILAFLGVTFTVAAPTIPTKPQGYLPTKPEPYGPEHSVTHYPWKRHIDAEAPIEERNVPTKPGSYGGIPTKPEPYGPEHSVTHYPWKRHVESEVEERDVEPKEPKEPKGPKGYEPEPPKPYPSGGHYSYERSVPVMEAPEHFEVLTA